MADGNAVTSLRFKDKVVIVTGGCTGIGKECVDVFLDNGAKVVILDIDEQTGAALSADRPEDMYFIPNFIKCDTSKENEVKGAVLAMTKTLAIDEAKHGVRVNSVSPGTIWTKMIEKNNKESNDEDMLIKGKKLSLLNRYGETREVGQACFYLACEGTYCTTAGMDVGLGPRAVHFID